MAGGRRGARGQRDRRLAGSRPWQQLIADLRARADELRAHADELEAIEAALAALKPDAVPRPRRSSSSDNRARVRQAVIDAPASSPAAIARAAGVSYMTARSHLAALQDVGDAAQDDRGRWIPATATATA